MIQEFSSRIVVTSVRRSICLLPAHPKSSARVAITDFIGTSIVGRIMFFCEDVPILEVAISGSRNGRARGRAGAIEYKGSTLVISCLHDGALRFSRHFGNKRTLGAPTDLNKEEVSSLEDAIRALTGTSRNEGMHQ